MIKNKLVIILLLLTITFCESEDWKKKYLLYVDKKAINYIAEKDSLINTEYDRIVSDDQLFILFTKQIDSMFFIRTYTSKYEVPLGIVICSNMDKEQLLKRIKINNKNFNIVKGIGPFEKMSFDYLNNLQSEYENVFTVYYLDFDYRLIDQLIAKKGKKSLIDSLMNNLGF